ncbi:MAG TPA: hypothetical protein VGG17_03830, partial [Acidimicrobiales bacterium]
MISRFAIRAARVTALALTFGLLGVQVGAHVADAASRLPPVGSWPYANGDLANSRDAVGSTITLSNVSTLKKIWSFTLTGNATGDVGGYGTLAANPIVVNGVVYIQDLHSNVYALSLATGKLEWSHIVNK